MATVVPDSALDGLPGRLRSADSVLLALAGGLGTGVFIVFAPAARAAGSWLLLALALAGLASLCSAVSAAELNRRLPAPRRGEALVPSAGRLGDVAFLTGRTAAAAAAGGVFATHVLPSDLLCASIPMIVIGGALTVAGVTVTARGARVLVVAVLSVLAVVVAVGLTGHAEAAEIPMEPPSGMPAPGAGQLGILTAAGLLFFAFAGFPRLDALTERPRHRGGRTLVVAFLVLVLLYLAVGGALLHSLGPARLADTLAPLAVASSTDTAPALGALVRIAAAAATVAAMLTVLASVGGAASAMAGRGDLPAWLVRTNRRARPWRIDVLATLGAVLIAVLAGPVGAVGLAACCLLVHSAEVNRAALRSCVPDRNSPMWTALLGLPLCLVLAVLLPLTQVLVSASLLVLGVLLAYRVSRRAPG